MSLAVMAHLLTIASILRPSVRRIVAPCSSWSLEGPEATWNKFTSSLLWDLVFFSCYLGRALRVVQVTWLMFAYTMENMSLRMRTLGWVYVKRSFLARKFPSEETISGAIFAVIITLLSYKGKRWSIQTQTLDVLQWRHGNIVLTKEA